VSAPERRNRRERAWSARANLRVPSTPARPPSDIEVPRAQVRQIEEWRRHVTTGLPFGLAEIDARLPGGGLALGALHEVAGGGNGAIDGAAAALFVAGTAARTRGKVLWCLDRPDLFAPALVQADLKSDRSSISKAATRRSSIPSRKVCVMSGWARSLRRSRGSASRCVVGVAITAAPLRSKNRISCMRGTSPQRRIV
jgi:hypothetical protein